MRLVALAEDEESLKGRVPTGAPQQSECSAQLLRSSSWKSRL